MAPPDREATNLLTDHTDILRSTQAVLRYVFPDWIGRKHKTEVKSTAEQFAEIQIINGEVTTGVIHVRFPSGVEISLENDPGTAYLRSLAGLVVSN